jgi:hypothetical protein
MNVLVNYDKYNILLLFHDTSDGKGAMEGVMDQEASEVWIGEQ